MIYYSVCFSPDDPEYPDEKVVERCRALELAIVGVYADIWEKQRPYYCSPDYYHITTWDTDGYDGLADEYIESEVASELMHDREIYEPFLRVGDRIRTPLCLRGTARDRKSLCEVTRISVEVGREWIEVAEVMSSGPSKSKRRTHYLDLDSVLSNGSSLLIDSRLLERQDEPGEPTSWVREDVTIWVSRIEDKRAVETDIPLSLLSDEQRVSATSRGKGTVCRPHWISVATSPDGRWLLMKHKGHSKYMDAATKTARCPTVYELHDCEKERPEDGEDIRRVIWSIRGKLTDEDMNQISDLTSGGIDKTVIDAFKRQPRTDGLSAWTGQGELTV